MNFQNLFSNSEKISVMLSDWAMTSGVRCLFIIIGAFIVLKILKWNTQGILQKYTSNGENKRLQTLASIANLALKVIIMGVAGALLLSEFGVDLAPIIATAGVFGLAIGFGAKELVSDLISGFFILLEDQVHVGDFVTVDGSSGTVEKMGLKTITLRDASGTLHFIRNGRISKIQNATRDYSFAVLNIGVSYDSSYEHVCSVLKAEADKLLADVNFQENFIGEFEIFGLTEFADSAVMIRCRFKTLPGKHWMITREFNKRIKAAFDSEGIEFPFPNRTVHLRAEGTVNDALKMHMNRNSDISGEI